MKLTMGTYSCFDRCVFLSLLLLYKTVSANECINQLLYSLIVEYYGDIKFHEILIFTKMYGLPNK